MRIVYVGGWQRSGTTLLGELVGSHPTVLHAGEVSGIWSAASRGGRCSCGELLDTCSVWGAALARVEAFGSVTSGQWQELGELTARQFRTKSALRLHNHRAMRLVKDSQLQWVVDSTTELLQAALEISGCDTLVDSSKLLPGLIFHTMTGANEISAIHIVRDPRAVAVAEARTSHVRLGNADFLPPGAPPVLSLARWYRANLSVAAGLRTLKIPFATVAYEKLAAHPAQIMRTLSSKLGFPFDESVLTEGRLDAGERHIAVGNPARLADGVRTIMLDDCWRAELSGATRVLVEVGAAPGRLMFPRKKG